VEYDQFIDRVAERTRLSREHAAMLTQATLQVLGDRISGGQAADLQAVLSDEELARPFRRSPQKPADAFDFNASVGKVRNAVPDLPYEAIIPGIRAVLLTLRDAVPDKEFRDTLAQLPHEFRDLLQGTDVPPQAPMPAHAAVDRGRPVDLGQGDAVVQRTAERTGAGTDRAARLAQATLQVLGDRIGGQQAHELAQRLPQTSAEWLDEPPETPAHDYGVDDFVSRIRIMVPDVSDDDLAPGIQAVIVALREAAGHTEVEIALAPLPDEYDDLLERAR
jgi:uncharacterized protein (DUF2267 family)